MYDLEHLRQTEFPLSQNTLYFNHASISPLPVRTRDKMQWASGQLSEHPTRHFGRDGMPMFTAFGAEIAAFINAASPSEIVPITSTSSGINAIAQALPWQPGDNIIFCDWEFPSNAYPWMSLERDGVEIRRVPSVNGGLTLEAVQAATDERTRLVAASAVQFFSGHRTDLAAIGAFCRPKNILFAVDAIQAAGHIRLDVQAMNIDILAAGGQKSLLSPPGVGFMYVREAVAESARPRLIGPNATKNWLFWLDYDLTPEDGAARFMAGTPNVVGMFGLLESLRLLSELGIENVDQHTTGLAAEAIEIMAGLGYEPITAREEHSAIVTFKSGMDDAHTQKLVEYLDSHNVSITKHLDPAGQPHLRLSFHCYNVREEIHRFADIIKGYSA